MRAASESGTVGTEGQQRRRATGDHRLAVPDSPAASRSSRPKVLRTPASEVEISIIEKLRAHVNFPPGFHSKRFIHTVDASQGLSERQRDFLALIAFRFRRQWVNVASEKEWIWIQERRMSWAPQIQRIAP